MHKERRVCFAVVQIIVEVWEGPVHCQRVSDKVSLELVDVVLQYVGKLSSIVVPFCTLQHLHFPYGFGTITV